MPPPHLPIGNHHSLLPPPPNPPPLTTMESIIPLHLFSSRKAAFSVSSISSNFASSDAEYGIIFSPGLMDRGDGEGGEEEKRAVVEGKCMTDRDGELGVGRKVGMTEVGEGRRGAQAGREW